VDKQDFLDAVDRVIGGLEKKNKIITTDEKKAIAYHEAGHATVSWLVEHASPLVKVTIVPRGRSLGAAWYLPEERHLTTTEQMLDEICAALGGRAAEDVMYGKVSTGALSDLEKVTKQAYAMVTMYGLNDRIGNISYYDSSGQNEYGFGKPYSERTAQVIDEEVSKIVEGQYATGQAHPHREQGQADRSGHPVAGQGGDLQRGPGEDLRRPPLRAPRPPRRERPRRHRHRCGSPLRCPPCRTPTGLTAGLPCGPWSSPRPCAPRPNWCSAGSRPKASPPCCWTGAPAPIP
jgi:hypothetical protein